MLIASYARVMAEDPAAAQAFLRRLTAEADRRYSGGAQYRDSTRHYYEVAHQDYLQALEGDLAALQAA
jgi:hypothetical protein